MKKSIVIILSLLILISGIIIGLIIKRNLFTEEPVVMEDALLCTKEKEVTFCTDKKLKPYNGFVINKYPNGYLEIQGHYKNGKLDGELKSYYPTGQLKNVNMFKNGIFTKEMKNYYLNGNLKFESIVKDKKEFITLYYENGSIASQGIFYNGIKEISICYNEQGKETDCDSVINNKKNKFYYPM